MNNSKIIIMENYPEIKQNIIDNFLNPSFRWTSINVKGMLIYTVKKLSWFPVEYDETNENLIFDIGKNIIIPIKVNWKQHDNKYVVNSFS